MKNILFLLADDLAARVVLGPDPRPPRPALKELMRRGTTFTQAISSATMTTQCVASIFTGCYSFLNGIRSLRGDVLLPSVRTLAQELHVHGYRTHALLTGPLWEGTGLERGFDRCEYAKPSPTLAAHWRDRIHTLMDSEPGQAPWFIYAHFYDMHAPRVVAPEFHRAEFGATVYERALATLDQRFAEILGRIDWDRTIVVFHADHGELFPETPALELREKLWQDVILGHKPPLLRLGLRKDPTVKSWTRLKRLTQMGHGFNLSEGLVRVPLIISGADALPAGQVVTAQARQVDLMPTLLELTGLIPPSGISGRSLVPLVQGRDQAVRPAYMETYGFGRDPNFFMRGLRLPEWKYIDSPTDLRVRPQLYDLAADPGERRNVLQQHPEVAAEMQRLLTQETTAAAPARENEIWTAEESAIVQERLRNLGYF